ncbi:CoA ester lyase [Actinomycetospora endophytica]|uniref:CoA ester lyase n=1 Tax=Actinomycetospora endophytica TaxID=2291215 RepID=A0ABS8PCN7_9PSEU|nr:CoA ester lyase [Actinomycetospora endophytica]MCD2196045.1 CoA ester lyase [Actinomycetospora endophytica]
MRVPRSLLFVPGGRPDMVAKVPRSAPDAVAVDLEDAVAAADKDAARGTSVEAVAALPASDTLVLIRINAPGTPWYDDDVAAVASSAAQGVVLPKLEDPAQLTDLAGRIGDRVVIAGLETGRGVARARELVPGVLAAYFGAEDYIASVGGRRSSSSREVLYARSEVLLATRLAGVGALDQTVVNVRDTELFRADAADGRDLGYDGKICIHPTQVGLAHEIFTPSDEEVAHARKVVQAGRSGVGVVDGEMVDDVHLRMAGAVLSRAGLEA